MYIVVYQHSIYHLKYILQCLCCCCCCLPHSAYSTKRRAFFCTQFMRFCKWTHSRHVNYRENCQNSANLNKKHNRKKQDICIRFVILCCLFHWLLDRSPAYIKLGRSPVVPYFWVLLHFYVTISKNFQISVFCKI